MPLGLWLGHTAVQLFFGKVVPGPCPQGLRTERGRVQYLPARQRHWVEVAALHQAVAWAWLCDGQLW